MALKDLHDNVPKLIREHLKHIGNADKVTDQHKTEIVTMLNGKDYGGSAKEISSWDLNTLEDFLVNIVFDNPTKMVCMTFSATPMVEVEEEMDVCTLRKNAIEVLRQEIVAKGLVEWLDEHLIEYDVIEDNFAPCDVCPPGTCSGTDCEDDKEGD